jgi:hypothetical protein
MPGHCTARRQGTLGSGSTAGTGDERDVRRVNAGTAERGRAMGRGRAKAKQTRVARDLKYHSPGMDLDRLRADLGGTPRQDDDPTDRTAWSDVYPDGPELDAEDETRTSSR